MKISFHGAARTVTGSKHLIHLKPDRKILLDCGMFQGMGKDTFRLNSDWGFEPTEVSTVILSHAHIDHIGLLPKLVKDGYRGRIYCTRSSEDLIRILLMDSAHIQQLDAVFTNKQRVKDNRELVEPLYTEADVQEVLPLLEPVDYNQQVVIEEGIELLYTDCGHILGSAAVNLTLTEQGKRVNLTFSGDVGRYSDMILRSPDVFPQADFIVMESTYGDRLHDLNTVAVDKLLDQINYTCFQKKGKLVVPAFSLGRTQELLYILNRLELERRLPALNYYLDSPLSIHITEIVKQHTACFNRHVQRLLAQDEDVFSFKGLKFVREVEDSIALNTSTEPCVIIAASGMAEAGRVKHHIKHVISEKKNTVLFSGYCEPNSLGGRLKAGHREVRIFGRPFAVQADIDSIDTLSAHGDYEDLSQWLSCQDKQQVRKLFLVHGEYDAQVNFRERLVRKGFTDVEIPNQHQVIGLGL